MEKLTKKERKELKKEEKLDYQKQLDEQQNMKRLSIWAVVLVLVVVSVFGLIKLASAPSSSSSSTSQIAKAAPVTQADIQTGPKTSKVTLVEYADFQCPGCGAMYPLLKQLLAEENGKVRFVYRFFPLTQVHKNAMLSADAAYAAYLQGKFWEMHDMLFENQNTWAASSSDNAKSIFQGYAQKIGLNIDKFNKDIDADDTQKFINDEENVGAGNGIQHTPTLYLNNKEVDDQVRTYDDLKKLVENELNKK